MTNEEWERQRDFIRDCLPKQPSDELRESRRKLDRDMNRLERALKACVGAKPEVPHRMRGEDERWRESARESNERITEISGIGAKSDEKLKALIDKIRKNRNQRPS